jgi:hypothetical protein
MTLVGGLYRSQLLRGQEASSEIRKFIQSEDIPRYSGTRSLFRDKEVYTV